MKDCLMIFVKNPVPGQVKTRLSPPLTMLESCRIYSSFVQDVLSMSLKVSADLKMIACSGDLSHLKISSEFAFMDQGEGDLGDRLARAFRWSFRRGFSKTIVLGSDAPSLPAQFVSKAFQFLDQNDLVIGPAWDGGYYLIGLKNFAPSLFKDIEWSTQKTLLQTLLKAKKLKKKIRLLPSWYDVDTYGDLRFLSLDLLSTRSRSKGKTFQTLAKMGL
jgi:rSAM/selenodomain-associated transferase 1